MAKGMQAEMCNLAPINISAVPNFYSSCGTCPRLLWDSRIALLVFVIVNVCIQYWAICRLLSLNRKTFFCCIND